MKIRYCPQCHTLSEGPICQNCGIKHSTARLSYYTEKDPYYEKYLLEQIAILEIRLNKLTEQVEKLKKLLFEKKENSRQNFLPFSAATNAQNQNKANNFERLEKQIQKIISQHNKPNLKLFSRLIYDSFEQIEKGQIEEGLQTLEKALFMSPENHALRYLLAKSLFEADKFEEAKNLLEKDFDSILKNEPKSALLLSIIYTDKFEVRLATYYLNLLPKEIKSTFCGLYTDFFLNVIKTQWEKALKIGKKLLKTKKVAEIHYLIGCVYFQILNPKAEFYLKKAIKMDSNFSDAWFMLGNLLLKLGKTNQAKEAFSKAWESRESGARCLEFFKQKSMGDLETALPFLKNEKRKILTNNSRRLSYLFRKELHEVL